MMERITRIQNTQRAADSNEFFVVAAYYGVLGGTVVPASVEKLRITAEEVPEEVSEDDIRDFQCVNVTTPLQFFTSNNELVLYATSKTSLMGFANPCFDSDIPPQLYIMYRFEGHTYEIVVGNEEGAILPNIAKSKKVD
jgi:hypothetical protein